MMYLRHSWMTREDFLYFRRSNVLSTTKDHVFQPVHLDMRTSHVDIFNHEAGPRGVFWLFLH